MQNRSAKIFGLDFTRSVAENPRSIKIQNKKQGGKMKTTENQRKLLRQVAREDHYDWSWRKKFKKKKHLND
jgi:hypothetical protein